MTRNKQTFEVATLNQECRRHQSTKEEAARGPETYEPGANVSSAARKHSDGASQLLNWHKLEQEGAFTAVTAGESVVPASESAAALAQIVQLQRMLGTKRMTAETLTAAVEFAREKKSIAFPPLFDKNDQ